MHRSQSIDAWPTIRPLLSAPVAILAAVLAMLAAAPARGQTAVWSRSGTNTPYSSTWNGTAWSAATAITSLAANGLWMKAAKKATGNEVVLGATDANSSISVMFNTGNGFGSRTMLDTDSGFTTIRKFDIAYEQISGEALMVYSNGDADDAMYFTATGGSMSAVSTAISSTNYIDYVELDSKPGSNEILLVCSNANSELLARVWNGSSWGSLATLSTALVSPYTEAFAGAYEATSGDALVVYAQSGSTAPRYRTRVGGTWSGELSMTACSGVPQYIHMASSPNSNQIICGMVDASNRVRVYIWNGSSWSSTLEVTTNATYSDRRPFDVAYQPDGQKAMIVYGDDKNWPVYRTHDGTSWSSATNMTNMGDKPFWVQVVPGASGGDLFILISDAGMDLHEWKWSGTAMSTMSTLETSLAGSGTTEPFSVTPATRSLSITSWQMTAP